MVIDPCKGGPNPNSEKRFARTPILGGSAKFGYLKFGYLSEYGIFGYLLEYGIPTPESCTPGRNPVLRKVSESRYQNANRRTPIFAQNGNASRTCDLGLPN